jgi:hypothetical protein
MDDGSSASRVDDAESGTDGGWHVRLDALGTARLILLGLSLACGVRAQEPVRPEPPNAQTRTAAEAADSPPRREQGSAARKPVASSQVNLEASAIRGSQELPKVLYIVPWKDPAMAELAGRPVNSLVEEALAPVDREVLRRQTRYFGQLYGAEPAPGGQGVPGSKDD